MNACVPLRFMCWKPNVPGVFRRWRLWEVIAAAKSLQSCLTLCDPIDGSPPGSPVPGFLQARTLEWVAISFSNAWKWEVKVKSLSRVRLFENPWTAAHQAPLSMGFSRQEYWSGVPLLLLVPGLYFEQQSFSRAVVVNPGFHQHPTPKLISRPTKSRSQSVLDAVTA